MTVGRGPSPLAPRRSGKISVLVLVAILFLTVLVAAEINVYRSTCSKLAVQNPSDAAALTAALTIARAINWTTGSNHLSGQLDAFVAVGDAIGGPEVARRNTVSTAELKGLETSLRLAGAWNGELSSMTERLIEPVRAEAAIYDGRVELRKWGLVAHGFMSAGKVAAASIFFAELAPGLYAAAYAIAAKVTQECIALDLLEAAAVAQAPLVEMARGAQTALAITANRAELQTGPSVSESVHGIASKNRISAGIFPVRPRLPVWRETESRGKEGRWPRPPGSSWNPTRDLLPSADLRPTSRSQTVRAGYPWLAHWRRPLCRSMELAATLSGVSGGIREWSDALLLSRADESIRSGRGLYLLRGSTSTTKGREAWRDATGRRLRDELFAILTVGYRPAAQSTSPILFGQARGYVVAVAQSQVYNANPSRAAATGQQPHQGWDTLNWAEPVPEFGSDLDLGCPRISLGWNATLIPISETRAADAGDLPPVLRAKLREYCKSLEFWTH
jgi:hypothetical protein